MGEGGECCFVVVLVLFDEPYRMHHPFFRFSWGWNRLWRVGLMDEFPVAAIDLQVEVWRARIAGHSHGTDELSARDIVTFLHGDESQMPIDGVVDFIPDAVLDDHVESQRAAVQYSMGPSAGDRSDRRPRCELEIHAGMRCGEFPRIDVIGAKVVGRVEELAGDFGVVTGAQEFRKRNDQLLRVVRRKGDKVIPRQFRIRPVPLSGGVHRAPVGNMGDGIDGVGERREMGRWINSFF